MDSIAGGVVKIDIGVIEKLYASLPQRVQAVYDARGGNTRY
jgi:hypothetical protein